jgi:hypothetical protein
VSNDVGSVPERPKGADCKSAGLRLRRFKSFPAHHLLGLKLNSLKLSGLN